jgi:malate dehydrogenase
MRLGRKAQFGPMVPLSAIGRGTQRHSSGNATKPQFKVCVSGGAGGIGQPLSMLMAMNPSVAEVSVQDVTMAMVPPSGVAADLGHLEFPSKVVGYATDPSKPAVDQLEAALTGCNLVLVPAGMPRKPGMTRDDLFNINAGIAKGIVEACAKYCPSAVVGLIVNPVNSVVPAMAELYKMKGLNPLNIVGVTTLDIVRANKFVSELTGTSPTEIDVPVIGGHAGVTIMPVFSQCPVASTLSADTIQALDKRTQDGGTEVVEAKAGKGSATLSMAYAGSRFGSSVLSGLAGVPTTECAYVASSVCELPYFSSKVTFGVNGVETVHGIGALNEYETRRLEEASAQLKQEIEKGLEFAKTF